MNQQVTLTVSENVWLYAKAVASRNKLRIDEVLSDWLEKVSNEIDVEKLSDSEVLALAELQMSPSQQILMDELQEENGEGALTIDERKQFDSLMEIYEDALLRKAQAFRVAVERGLMPPLSSE
jgi:ABC-type transport system involved in cytochrome c biogenesis ATPase subunit